MLKKLGASAAMVAASFAIIPLASATTGAFVDGKLGYANQSTQSEFDFTSYGGTNYNSLTQERLAWSGAVGYNSDINERVGLGFEVGYADYNKVEYKNRFGNTLKNAQTSISALLDLTMHVSPEFDLIAKGGIAYAQARSTYNGTFAQDGISQTAKLYEPMVSVGAGWNVTPQFNVHLNWDHIFGSKISTEDVVDAATRGKKIDKFQTQDVLWLGLKYTFPM